MLNLSNFIFIDFEFNRVKESKVNLICASILMNGVVHNFWLDGSDKSKSDLTQFLKQNINKLLVCYGGEAESRSLISLGLNPTEFKWIDLHLEYKMMLNHCREIMTGKHLVKGTPKIVVGNQKVDSGLIACIYRLLGVHGDQERKDKMRDLIISDPMYFTDIEKKEIQDYCESDVHYLPKILEKVMVFYNTRIPPQFRKDIPKKMLWRGETSARVAKITTHGLPINVEWVDNISENAPMILFDCCKDINSQFPEILPFAFNKKEGKYSMRLAPIREWIKNNGPKDWPLTDGGTTGKKQLSLALDAWEDNYPYRHDYPRNNFPAQMLRFLKLSQSLRSFNKSDTDKSFYDALGPDGFSRPYLNQYGSQSSRYQPPSTTFLFLKSAFFRSVCQPPSGWVMGGIDFSSQEFLLAALISGDKEMLEAYKQGDVYLYFGKKIGLIPPDGTKNTHKKERDLCKSTVLGLSYSMTCVGLAKKLTADTGIKYTEEQAQKLIDDFNNLFRVFYQWKEDFLNKYWDTGVVELPDGWLMFGDNHNPRSITNVPIQGFGAAILRKTIQLAQDRGLNITHPLHDAAYQMFKLGNYSEMDTLAECMEEAFCFYFTGQTKEDAKCIRLELECWGPDLDKGTALTPKGRKIITEKIHVDERGHKEYDMFKQYFQSGLNSNLL